MHLRDDGSLRRTSLRQRWQRLVRRYVWKSQIAPSAWIAPTALIDRTWPRGVHIDDDVVIGEEAVVLTHDMTRGVYLDTHIGARCIIGARAIILPGISIGADCVVEAGALVNRDLPAAHRAAGNPAKITAIAGGAVHAAA